MILRVGLSLHPRNETLYGPGFGKYMHTDKHAGLCQNPTQLATTMLFMSKRRISSYLELGIAQAWTVSIMSAYLRRFSPAPSSFKAWAVDISFALVGRTTHRMLKDQLNVQLVRRQTDGGQVAPRLVKPDQPTIDLCHIDGDHHYGHPRTGYASGVLYDYVEFAPYCKTLMFHDVFDFDTYRMDPYGGSTRFWADVKANLPPSRVHEFVQQPGIFPPTLGIGVITPADADARRQPRAPYPWKLRSTAAYLYDHGPKDFAELYGIRPKSLTMAKQNRMPAPL